LKNRSENLTGRSQISSILKGNSSSIARESGGIWIVQADLQPISFKSDRLLGTQIHGLLNELIENAPTALEAVSMRLPAGFPPQLFDAVA